MAIDRVDAYLEAHRDDFEEQLKALLRIPSISAQPTHTADTRRAAEFVHDDLRAIGFEAELIATAGHPIVYAERHDAPGKPTLLVYGHYDVQPPEPLEPWLSPPFEPTVRDGNLYARGATDDKGQMFTHLKAAEGWLKAAGRLPLNLKILIEGEEEVGGANLETFVAENRARLACDYAVISDTSQFARDQPAITYGLKGLAYFELIVRGANTDLHSGTFGGAVANPCNALATILASLKGPDNRITHRRLLRPGPAPRRLGARRVRPAAVLGGRVPGEPRRRVARRRGRLHDPGTEVGAADLRRQRPLRRLPGSRPQDRAPLHGRRQAQLSPRARPGPEDRRRAVPGPRPNSLPARRVLRDHRPPRRTGGSRRYQDQGVRAAVRAIEAAFGKPPVFMREGGSIPVVGLLKTQLGVDTLLLGWGQNDDNLHGPNEKFALADFHRGIKASAHLLAELAKE